MIPASQYFLSYQTPQHDLSEQEKATVDILTQVVQIVGSLYGLQVNKKFPGGNFYPKDLTKEDIERAAQSNAEILSHFTIVERSHDSDKIIPVPYHVRYHVQLKKIEQLLLKASSLTKDRKLCSVLHAQIKALRTDAYEEAIVTNMIANCQRIRFWIGPMEPYEDKFFYKKYGYQAWVSTLNTELTKRCDEIKNLIIRHRREAFSAERIQFLEKTRVCVENTIAAGGLMVDYRFSGETLPNRPDLIERYGAIATLNLPVLQYVFNSYHMRIFESVFERHFRDGFSRPLLERSFFYLVLLHEISRFLTRFRTGVKRLQGLYPIFNEMTTELLAIRLASYLLLKNVFTEKEFEAILVMYICRLFDRFEGSTSRSVLIAFRKNDIKAHVASNVLMLNVLLHSGSIKYHGGISWPNFVRVFLEIDHMIEPAERIFAEGNYEDAMRFIQKYGSLEGMKRLHPIYGEMKPKDVVQV